MSYMYDESCAQSTLANLKQWIKSIASVNGESTRESLVWMLYPRPEATLDTTLWCALHYLRSKLRILKGCNHYLRCTVALIFSIICSRKTTSPCQEKPVSHQCSLPCMPLTLLFSFGHLQQKAKSHPRLFWLIGLPHDIVSAPDVIGQVVCHALAQVWLYSGHRKGNWLSWADQSCIKGPAYKRHD